MIQPRRKRDFRRGLWRNGENTGYSRAVLSASYTIAGETAGNCLPSEEEVLIIGPPGVNSGRLASQRSALVFCHWIGQWRLRDGDALSKCHAAQVQEIAS